MEIDIPSLDDVEFVTRCGRCNWQGMENYQVNRTWLKRPCESCKGTHKVLTTPGEKLLQFLTDIGVVVPNPNGWQNV